MSGQVWMVRNALTAQKLYEYAVEHIDDKLDYRVMKHAPKRSLSANALSHVWYAEIAKQKGDETPEDIRRHCKAYFGIPILLRDSQEFRERYSRLIKTRFTTEEKLELMGWFPVTSLMSKTQMKEYLETLQNEFGKQGIILESVDYGV